MENQTIQTPTSEAVTNPVSTQASLSNRKWIYILLALFIVGLLASTSLLYYQNKQLKELVDSQQIKITSTPSLTISISPQPTLPLTPTVTGVPSKIIVTPTKAESEWSTYTNSFYGYSLSYPKTWTLIIDPKTSNTEFRFNLKSGEIVRGWVTDKSTNNNLVSEAQKLFDLSNKKQLLIIYNENDQQRGGFGSLEMDTFKKFLSTFKSFSVPPIQVMVPSGWKEHFFPTLGINIYAPKDWKSSLQAYPEVPSNLIRLWQGATAATSTIQLDIKDSWANTGDAPYLPKNFIVGDNISAVRVDPPLKTQQTLDRYQTNVYFEYAGKTHVFMCVHNWIPAQLQICNTMLTTIKFTQ